MPRISLFYGIIIKMFFDDHNPPHLHAEYQDFEASFNFDGELLRGEMPLKQTKLIAAWCEIHREDLEADWKLASNGENPVEIEPLR